MKTSLLIFLLSLWFLVSYCQQSKKIPPEEIYNLRTSKFLLLIRDSSVEEYDGPLLEVEKLAIKISDVFFNSKTDEIRVIGRTCFGDTANNMGVPSVSIFKGVRKDGILSNLVLIGETTNNHNLKDHGFFDVSIKFKENESLYFFMPQFHLEEFKLGMLLRSGHLRNER